MAYNSRPPPSSVSSQLFDESGKISIAKMLENRKKFQSGTGVKSERVVALQMKYQGDTDETESNPDSKIGRKEASYRLRVAQNLNPTFKAQEVKKTHQLRWAETVKAIESSIMTIKGTTKAASLLPNLAQHSLSGLFMLKRGSFLVMRSSLSRYYVGEVLDIYKKGESSRYGSIPSSATLDGLSWLSLRVYLPLGVVSAR